MEENFAYTQDRALVMFIYDDNDAFSCLAVVHHLFRE